MRHIAVVARGIPTIIGVPGMTPYSISENTVVMSFLYRNRLWKKYMNSKIMSIHNYEFI